MLSLLLMNEALFLLLLYFSQVYRLPLQAQTGQGLAHRVDVPRTDHILNVQRHR